MASSLDALRDSLGRDDEADALFHTALLVSALEHPDWQPGWWGGWHGKLDELAALARNRVMPCADGREAVQRLAQFYSGELGFAGNRESYHDPANSFLTQVIDSRRGLPITLAVLLVAIGRRLGIDMFGVGTPGHFLAGAHVDGAAIYVDPFNGPDVYSQEGATQLVSALMGLTHAQVQMCLKPAPTRDVVVRMLNNLKVAYLNRSDLPGLLASLEWLLAVEPGNLVERRNRGLILLRSGRKAEGARDLLAYLQGTTDPPDLALIHKEIARASEAGSGDR